MSKLRFNRPSRQLRVRRLKYRVGVAIAQMDVVTEDLHVRFGQLDT